MTFREIAMEMADIQERKNKDYGGAFQKTLEKWGLTAPAIRLEDKFNRFCNLIKKEREVQDESVADTLIDMAAYALMTVQWLREKGGGA